MQFLKTLFWVTVAVVAVLFFYTNWHSVTLKLWGGLEADVKLPFMVMTAFLLGFLPTFIIYRARLWSLRRRLEGQAQAHVVSHPAPARPVTPATNNPDRQATDAKAWPAG
jgi:lipopolysaccharide assembly protein A